MKVLDLQCSAGHRFEGWFSSEDEFQRQRGLDLVECPLCGTASVRKCLSAPRLNLGSNTRADASASTSQEVLAAPQALDMAALRKMIAQAEDVGVHFAQEARRIHYQEAPERRIRGEASVAQVMQLLEEGIDVMPIPQAFKPDLH